MQIDINHLSRSLRLRRCDGTLLVLHTHDVTAAAYYWLSTEGHALLVAPSRKDVCPLCAVSVHIM